MSKDGLHLRLPATSANLGPGFDAIALALSLFLDVHANPAKQYSIHATGRNADICGALEQNLLLQTYKTILEKSGAKEVPLSLEIRNGIPLGMGCGSSAATRLAGVALASHFGKLAWDRSRILTEASRLEGHPDNTAACWLGGFTIACWRDSQVEAISLTPRSAWRALVVMPRDPLATTLSRKVVPEVFSRQDLVFNLQRVALLTATFATGHGELLRTAVEDRVHQPYRAEVCPLLKQLLPLSGTDNVLSVTLSGAGPSVLVLVRGEAGSNPAKDIIRQHAGEDVEILDCNLELNPALCQTI